MSIITTPLPYVFSNGTTADATQVNADLNQIVSGVNNNAAANGTNADITSMTALATITHALSLSSTLGVTGPTTLAAASATALDSTPIGGVTPAAGKFTTLAATSLDSTPIGGVTPAAGAFTTLSANTSATLTSAVLSGATTISSTAQPAFSAHKTVSQTTPGTMVCDVVDNQQGGTNYSSSTGIFTAPRSGWYLFTAGISVTNGGAASYASLQFYVNGSLSSEVVTPVAASTSGTYIASRIYFLSATNTVNINVGASATFSINGSTTPGTFFAGVNLF